MIVTLQINEYRKRDKNHRQYRNCYVPIRYHVKIKGDANPYLQEYDSYFFKGTKWSEDLTKECKQITTFMSNNNSRA